MTLLEEATHQEVHCRFPSLSLAHPLFPSPPTRCWGVLLPSFSCLTASGSLLTASPWPSFPCLSLCSPVIQASVLENLPELLRRERLTSNRLHLFKREISSQMPTLISRLPFLQWNRGVWRTSCNPPDCPPAPGTTGGQDLAPRGQLGQQVLGLGAAGSFWCSFGHCVKPRTERHGMRAWRGEKLIRSGSCGLWCPYLDCGSLLWGRGGASRGNRIRVIMHWQGLCGKRPPLRPPELKPVQAGQGAWSFAHGTTLTGVLGGPPEVSHARLPQGAHSLLRKEGLCSRTPCSHT